MSAFTILYIVLDILGIYIDSLGRLDRLDNLYHLWVLLHIFRSL